MKKSHSIAMAEYGSVNRFMGEYCRVKYSKENPWKTVVESARVK